MPIESQTDAHRTENQQASGERRIITGKNTSEKETSSIRKESGPHPNKTKNALTDKNAILIDNTLLYKQETERIYPIHPNRKVRTGNPRRTQHRRHHNPEKSPRYRQHFRPENHKIQGTLRRLLRCQPVGGSVRDRRGTLPSPRPLVYCRHAPYTQVRGQRIVCRHPPQTPLPRLPTSKSDRTTPETKKQALRVGEPAIDRRIYRYGQETAHTIPVI